MAIEYVGGKTVAIAGSFNTVTNVSLTDLTGGLASAPANGDLAIVAFATATATNRDLSLGTSGYTEIADLYANDGTDANLAVFWKRMGSTPDTSVDVNATGGTAEPGAVIVRVWRDVDAITPLDVTSTTATRIDSWVPDPPAITPTTAGSIIEVFGAGVGGASGSAAIGALSSSELTAFLSRTNAGGTRSVGLGAGYFAWSSGAFNPAAFTVSGTDAATYSAASLTLAMRPSSGATSGPVGTATTTDTARTLGVARPALSASTTDTAFALASARPTGTASTTDTAQALISLSIGRVGTASTTDIALALEAGQAGDPVGLASTVDTALALGGVQITATGLATSADVAAALGSARPAGTASTSDTAQALTGVQIAPVGTTNTSDTAQALAGVLANTVGTATSSDTAAALGSARPAGLAASSETAVALGGAQVAPVGLATSADTAAALGSARPAGAATATATAQALTSVSIRQVGTATATDTALVPTPPPPPAVVFSVTAEETVFSVLAEETVFSVDAQTIVFITDAESTTFTVELERTTFEVLREAA